MGPDAGDLTGLTRLGLASQQGLEVDQHREARLAVLASASRRRSSPSCVVGRGQRRRGQIDQRVGQVGLVRFVAPSPCGPGRRRPSRTAPTPPTPSPPPPGSTWPPGGTRPRRRSSAAPTVPGGSCRSGPGRRPGWPTPPRGTAPSASSGRRARPPPTGGPRPPGRPPPPWPAPRVCSPDQSAGPRLRLDLAGTPPVFSAGLQRADGVAHRRLGLLGQPIRRRTDDPGASTPATRPPAWPPTVSIVDARFTMPGGPAHHLGRLRRRQRRPRRTTRRTPSAPFDTPPRSPCSTRYPGTRVRATHMFVTHVMWIAMSHWPYSVTPSVSWSVTSRTAAIGTLNSPESQSANTQARRGFFSSAIGRRPAPRRSRR